MCGHLLCLKTPKYNSGVEIGNVKKAVSRASVSSTYSLHKYEN